MINVYTLGALAAIRIAPHALAGMFTPHGPWACLDGLPEGSTLVAAGKYEGDLVLVFEHGSFPVTALGQPLTVLVPVYQSAPATPTDREVLTF